MLSEAVKLGEAFTSSSQGFIAESIRMSYPYSCTQHHGHAAATRISTEQVGRECLPCSMQHAGTMCRCNNGFYCTTVAMQGAWPL